MASKQRREKGSGSISQLKDGRWTARIQVGLTPEGKPKIKALYANTEREAKKKLKEFTIELHKYDSVNVQKGTVETYMLDWLYSVKSNELKPKSFDRLEQTLKYQVIPNIGHLQVAAIQPDDIQKMVNTLRDSGLSYSTVKKSYDAVNDCFRRGVIKRTIMYNPALGVSVPAKKTFGKSKIKYYTKMEAESLCEAATKLYKNGKPVYRLGNIVKFTLNSGLRLAELVGLRWQDISFEDRTITIAQTVVLVKDRKKETGNKYIALTQDSAKTATSERTIYMNDEALEALKQLHEVTGDFKYVFATEDGNMLNPRYLDRLFRKISVAAGLPEDKIYGIHSLRHTFASFLFADGVDVKTVSRILGHSDITITYNTYIHLIAEQEKKAVAKIGKKEEKNEIAKTIQEM